uniref:C-type lectin domain-containing protein n=1 Tax=Steinernema glaseri TaxID=37863 RepID=A0A1I7ZR12_9BILA
MLVLHKKNIEITLQRVFNRVLPKSANVFWIGLHKPQGIRSKFTWTDGSALDYTNWAKGQPRANPSKECAAYWTPNWAATNCANKYFVVCQKK